MKRKKIADFRARERVMRTVLGGSSGTIDKSSFGISGITIVSSLIVGSAVFILPFFLIITLLPSLRTKECSPSIGASSAVGKSLRVFSSNISVSLRTELK